MRRSIIVAAVAGIALVATASPAHATIADKRNDYNGDGISDLVAIDSSTDCLVRWLGNGSGGFGSGTQLGCGNWNVYRNSLAAPGDLNRDGVGDLVAINSTTDCLVRWLGGGFGTGVQLGCDGWSPYDRTLTGAGDLNNDGNGDLVAINSTTDCLVRWFGNGSGGLGNGVQLGCGWSPYRLTLTGAGDLNNDGNGDLTGIDSTSGCLVRWLGNGSGGFNGGTQLGCGWSHYLADGNLAGMGTLNADGHGDLVGINLASGSGCLVRWHGNGSGGYGSGVQFGCNWRSYFLAA